MADLLSLVKEGKGLEMEGFAAREVRGKPPRGSG